MHIYAARPLSTNGYWGLLIRHLDSQSWRRLKRCRNERQPLTPFRKRIVYIDRMFTSKIVLTTDGVVTQTVIWKGIVVCMGAISYMVLYRCPPPAFVFRSYICHRSSQARSGCSRIKGGKMQLARGGRRSMLSSHYNLISLASFLFQCLL